MNYHVFAYGTLMFPEVWRAVVGQQFDSLPGHIRGFKRKRFKNEVYPGVIATVTDDVVDGILYENVNGEALDRLDAFEEEVYRRELVPVFCDDGRPREAYVYVVPPANDGLLTEEIWSPEEFQERGDLRRFVDKYTGFLRIPKE